MGTKETVTKIRIDAGRGYEVDVSKPETTTVDYTIKAGDASLRASLAVRIICFPALPINTTIEDIEAVCPTDETIARASQSGQASELPILDLSDIKRSLDKMEVPPIIVEELTANLDYSASIRPVVIGETPFIAVVERNLKPTPSDGTPLTRRIRWAKVPPPRKLKSP